MVKKKKHIIQIKDKSYIQTALSPTNSFCTAMWFMVMPSIKRIVSKIYLGFSLFILSSQNIHTYSFKDNRGLKNGIN